MSGKSYTRDELLKGIRERDKTVFSYINDTFRGKMVNYVVSLGGSRDDGYDIFQDTLIILMKQVDKDTFSVEISFRSMLMVIGKNLYLKKKRDTKETVPLDVIGDLVSNEPLYEDIQNFNVLYTIILKQLRKLRELCREILWLARKNTPSREIAERLDMDVRNVYNQRNICKGELIDRIRKHPDYMRMVRVDNEPVKGDK